MDTNPVPPIPPAIAEERGPKPPDFPTPPPSVHGRTSRRRRGPGRPKPRSRRYVATRRFTDEERARIFEAARGLNWTIRPRRSRADGSFQPSFDGTVDPEFAYRTVRVLDLTACHISMIPVLRSQNVYRDSIGTWSGWVIGFERPKNKRFVKIPFLTEDQDMLPWIGPYLDQPRPQGGRAYVHLLHRLSDRLSGSGEPIHLNPLRFRHTRVVKWQRFGLSNREVAYMAGCSPSVVAEYYLEVDQDDAVQRLAALGSSPVRTYSTGDHSNPL